MPLMPMIKWYTHLVRVTPLQLLHKPISLRLQNYIEFTYYCQ